MQTNTKPDMGFFDMPFYLFLFGEEDPPAGDPQVDPTVDPKADPKPADKSVPKVSVKHPSESEDAYKLRVELEEAKADAKSAKDRIAELNAENLKRRKTSEALESRLNTADKRVIRAEAKEALLAEGVINARVVDLFLADIGDKAKIDPHTGDAIGIRDNLATWKESNKDFFKAAASGDADPQKDLATSVDLKKNATSTGASTAGGSTVKQDSGGLPDLRTIADPKERAAAYKSWKASLRKS